MAGNPEPWSSRPLSRAGLNGLRHLSGDKSAPWPRSRQAQEQMVRGLIARGLINTDGWGLTDAGRAALASNTGGEMRWAR